MLRPWKALPFARKDRRKERTLAMTRSVLTPRPAMTSRELDLWMARGKDARTEALRLFGRWVRSRVSLHPVLRSSHHGHHGGIPSTI